MILLIDNFDSFTYNVYQFLTELTDIPVEVHRNNAISIEDIREMNPHAIIISPGPGRPEDAGISMETVRTFAGKIPILGVCLGHQVIGEVFGGKIIPAARIVHGMVEPVSHDGKGVFRNLSAPLNCTRYHSLAIEEKSLPAELEITARTPDGEIMGVRHRDYVVEGVQFHPESIASEEGKRMLRNFLNYRKEPFDVKGKLEKIMNGQDLNRDEAVLFMEELTDGSLSDIHIAGYLTAFNTKGVCAEEIAGCASVLHKKRVPVKTGEPVLDIVGTGGDGIGTFNISSFSALVAAAGGAAVAKHGNRAVSSRSGSADFYREMGVPVDISPQQAEKLLSDARFSFLFAPVYHKAMRFAAPVRKALGVKSIMNLLGPLVNPAAAEYQIIGVYREDLCEIMADAAHMLGVKRVMVIYGQDGIDELSVSAPSRVIVIDERGQKEDYIFDPAALGIGPYSLDDLKGGDAAENAALARDLLDGKGRPAIRDAVLLNGGAGLYIYGLAGSIEEGYKIAKTSLESGKVQQLLGHLQGSFS
ncbi:bifunctional anthranilate synthase component II/anthranilate phosphoribosyltransferase [Spirochaeta isovalerica]|uniref:Anthranilate phosphoribosyltransferase n=1 Tax=Spirochaeta isovalerica TaxID=150 RepID=A0A841RE69_9SPIO|nr:bifunctional anthranilate synthase component II/anthranilate phosphoribosyltransferase [Spirochaeta isovalerica]MBB6481916.1 anthranilate synthase/phosphoribosyltransferase [Spirochaeta isovalerica]